jgi:hypothetical protein
MQSSSRQACSPSNIAAGLVFYHHARAVFQAGIRVIEMRPQARRGGEATTQTRYSIIKMSYLTAAALIAMQSSTA